MSTADDSMGVSSILTFEHLNMMWTFFYPISNDITDMILDDGPL